MSKNHAAVAAVYLAAGVAVAAWSAHRGFHAQPHFTGFGANPGVALASTVLLWPYAAVVNLTAKPNAAAA